MTEKTCPKCFKKFDFDAEYDDKYNIDLCKKCDDNENNLLNAYMLLQECGVPFNDNGEPLGIGWD